MFKAIVILCILVTAIVFFLSMGDRPGTSEGIHFTFNNGPEVNSLDPQVISWKHDIRIANALFEGLMSFKVLPPEKAGDPGQVVVVKGAAKDYKVSEDSLVYTFQLDPAAKWSNGEKVTAADFAWSFQRLMTPMTAGDYAQMMFVIKGGRNYYEQLAAGRAISFDSVGVKVVDSATLEVTLEAPRGYFLELLAFPPFFPVYRPLLDLHPVQEASELINGVTVYDTSAWTQPGVLIGNGPFVLDQHVPRSHLVLKKNIHYRDAASVQLDTVTALAIDDNNASLNAYESGLCDLIDSIPISTIRDLVGTDSSARRSDFHYVSSFGTYFYRFNCQDDADGRKNPLSDPRVRKAFALVADKTELVQKIVGGGQSPARSFVPPNLSVSDPQGNSYQYPHINGLERDIKAAQNLLADAGYPGGQGLGKITLLYNSGANHELAAQRMKKIWLDTLGVDVQLAGIDANAFGQELKRKSDKIWHIARSAWFGDYRDPSNFLEMFASDNGNNDCGFIDTEVDDLIARAAASSDQQLRMELLSNAERIVVEQKPAILPLYHYCEHYLIRPGVGGVYPNAYGYTILGDVYMEK